MLSCFLLNSKWTCEQLCALWKACLWSIPPTMSAPHLKASAVPYCKLCFSPLSASPFHNNASFGFFFFAVESGWMERMGVGVLDFTAIAACFQHGRGHVCGCGQGQSVALVKYTSPLHKSQQLWSQPKIMPKRLFWNKFSTLDVSCSCPLCSIGSYFGEASLGAFI